MHGWRILILPYIEQNDLYEEYDFTEPWDGANNRKLASRMPRIFTFHGDAGPGNTTANYLAVVGLETVWQPGGKVSREDVTDGSSNTILLVENEGAGVHWMEPRDLSFADLDYRLNSPRGLNSKYTSPAVALADGSVRRLDEDLDPLVLRAMLTLAGGERLDANGPHGWRVIPDGRQRPLKPGRQ